MPDYLNKSLAIGGAMALYGCGVFMGIAGGCLIIVMGAVALVFGYDLVDAILITAGISAAGLTIGDHGRKKLRALQAAHRAAHTQQRSDTPVNSLLYN